MKYEWKKSEKEIYLPKNEPTLIKVPRYKYFTITGQGNPNSPDFADKVSALYSLAYAVRMMPRNGFTPNGYFEYTVYPLEGVWRGGTGDKNSFSYTIMIRQPDFVDENTFEKALEIASEKKPNPNLANVKFEEIEDGLSVQMLHVGSYDDEPTSFARMAEFMNENSYQRISDTHREIYLSDPGKVTPEKLKTVLRWSVK
ncbi:GyrI-like domain-containing protein [Candidatus Saccharibacteria bacterium]|nr:GyrI-like domain-containing protein [Candidatus Saccharibacteria bacterium]